MTLRFADFELDEACRELRLHGRELPLQPRVFDLILYLIHHRDRVVGKEELLDTLWAGRVVVDGALQRVVSLARSALQQGNARDLIRTYSGRGYRFCTDVVVAQEEVPKQQGRSGLDEAHAAFQCMDWDRAVAAFRAADASVPLGGVDLERWAQAAQWSGQPGDAVEPLERGVAAHLGVNDRAGAARAALLLAQIALERRDTSVAIGWHRRAARFLEGVGQCRELGLHHYLAARIALYDGDLDVALEQAQATRKLGLKLDDPDLEGLGMLYAGHALLALGKVGEGLDLQNEAAAAVLAGETSPWVGALIYCGVVYACRNRSDWSQATQWTEQFSRWCSRHGLAAFPGTCRLHRAEVLSVHGELEEAEREIVESTLQLSTWAPWAAGDAYRVLGDLRLSRGDLTGAADAFERARKLGWDPQPGYAGLLMAQGSCEAAAQSLEDSLVNPNWVNRERRGVLLSHLILACARAGRLERGQQVLEELLDQRDLWATPALEAVVLCGQAEIARAGSRQTEAVRLIRQAAQTWRHADSPLNEAHVRLRLAEWLLESGEVTAAGVELDLVMNLFRKHGAAQRLLEFCRKLQSGVSKNW